ncbi:MAG TPA: PD-(D/E)XK nuclease family protein [Bryobacteraceae bacterium]|nr:PD-(D/E)XK nuclease family protein [Bryobacteraceae bacterium]
MLYGWVLHNARASHRYRLCSAAGPGEKNFAVHSNATTISNKISTTVGNGNLKQSNRGWLALLAFALGLFTLLPFQANADDISDLRRGVERFHHEADSLYRLDNSDLEQIWDAYCGVFDPKIVEDREFATDIGRQLQDKERGLRDQLMGDELPKLLELAKRIQQTSDAQSRDKDEAKKIAEGLAKEQRKLQDLDNGVILKGSNHPFIQYAIEYGKKEHQDMCTKFGDSSTRVCDKNFPGIDGRPDLVAIEGGHLVVYEFKPDNSKAKAKGEKQVRGYLDAVEAYYQKFFENGRTGGFKDTPPSEYGGTAILNALKNSPETWSSDGQTLHSIPIVETYTMCEKKFN